jgi:molybdate-binding protein
VTFAIWEQGLILSAGSQIGGIEDVSRKDVRIINREKERAAATFSISTSTPPASLPMA